MKKSSCCKLHFRHPESTDYTPYSICCSVVDVCVNQELLKAIRQNRQLQDVGVLVRLHWGSDEEYSDISLSTITLSQGDQSKAVISPECAIAVATNPEHIEKFATEMLNIYHAKLVAVQYPPFAVIFHHQVDFEIGIFTSDKYRLHGILKDLVSQSALSGNRTKLTFKINKGSRITLPKMSLCHCLMARQRDALCRQAQPVESISKRDVSCLTDASPNDTPYLSDICDEDMTTGSTVPEKIGERFSSLQKELAEQRTFVGAQLNEQLEHNKDMKTLLLHLTQVLTKGHAEDIPQTTLKGQSVRSSLDKEDLIHFSSLHSVADKTRRKTGLDTTDQDAVDENHDQEDQIDLSKNRLELDRVQATAVLSKLVAEENDLYFGDEQEKGRGKGILGDELRSLPPNRAASATKIRTSGQKTSSLNHIYSHHNCFTDTQSQGDSEWESRPSSGATVLSQHGWKKDVTYRQKYTEDNRNGSDDLLHDGQVDKVPQGLMTRVTGSALSRPNARVDTRRFQANQPEPFDDTGMDDMMYGGRTTFRDAYTDLQTNDINFDISNSSTYTHRGTTISKTRISIEPEGEDRLRLLIDCMIGNNANKERLWESVEDALTEDEVHIPYVDKVLDTVICVDTSESVKGDTFKQIKIILHEFINGVEDIAEQYELEENIAIVTFGGRARILHKLSNDYGSLLDAIDEITPGGPSPMLEGVLVSLASLSKGGELNFRGCLKLPPRLLILTDGLATGEQSEASADKYGTDVQQKILLTNAFGELRKRQPGDYFQGQITIIPVGGSDMSFLLALAKLCGGSLIDGASVKKLCKHQRLHKLAGDALQWLRNQCHDPKKFVYGFASLPVYCEGEVQPHERAEVRGIVQENLDNVIILYGTIYTFDNIHEVPGLPPLGSRVTRGVDWIWGNQDTEGAGTIFNHGLGGQYVWVLWDNGVWNVYRYGRNDCFDVMVVYDHPRNPNDPDFSVGLQVERGHDWHVTYGNQDGGSGKPGIIIRERPEIGRVKVRWQNGDMFEYRYGENNMFDLSILDPLACLLVSTAKP